MTTPSSRMNMDKIKRFQSRVLNRSIGDLLLYDKVADYLLQWFSTQTKPNLLSLLSMLPLFMCNVLILINNSPSWWLYILCGACIFFHQIFDIANKKQAYRLMQFTFSMYYIDHLCDTFSMYFIVNIVNKMLFELSNQNQIILLFAFGMLPFYTHHLAMYTNGYLTFGRVSPGVQGLLIIQILLIICSFYPQLPMISIFGIRLNYILLSLFTIWLIVFLLSDIITINRPNVLNKQSSTTNESLQFSTSNLNKQNSYPIKNMFIMIIFGYIILQSTIIKTSLLTNMLYQVLFQFMLMLMYSIIIGEMLLAYGEDRNYRQVKMVILVEMAALIVYYSIIEAVQVDIIVNNCIMIGLLLPLIAYTVWYHYTNLKNINIALKYQQ